MKLGVNNEVNPGRKKAAFKLMAGGPSKISPPNSHPSNPIHKAAMAAQTGKPGTASTSQANAQTTEPTAGTTNAQTTEPTSQHEINKTAVITGKVGLTALLFMAAH